MTDPRLQDKMLIERGQQGDTSAIDELLRRHQGKALVYAMRMTKHVEDAKDLVSDGFIRIHRAIGRFQTEASFSTWMFRIIRNCFIDTCKKKRVLVIASLDAGIIYDGSAILAQPIDESDSPYEASVRAAYSRQVHQAIQMLPIQQRELVLMYYSDHLSYDEIAVLLNAPPTTIKGRLHRARLSLKQLIKSDSNLYASLAFSA